MDNGIDRDLHVSVLAVRLELGINTPGLHYYCWSPILTVHYVSSFGISASSNVTEVSICVYVWNNRMSTVKGVSMSMMIYFELSTIVCIHG